MSNRTNLKKAGYTENTEWTQCFNAKNVLNALFRIRIDPGFFADPDPSLKVRIRIHPFINLCDLNDSFDMVLEEPDQKGQC